jgi:hypothetical protein
MGQLAHAARHMNFRGQNGCGRSDLHKIMYEQQIEDTMVEDDAGRGGLGCGDG